MTGDSADDIAAVTSALQTASASFGAEVQDASSASAAGSGGSSDTASGEDVVDADFEEVDDQDGKRHA